MVPKFRCWDDPNKIMRFNDEIVIWNDQVYINEKKELDSRIKGYSCLSEHLMQSTGLKDKNGVEIFESDLVKITVSNGFDHLEDALSIVKEAEYHSGLICKLLSNTLEYRIFDEEATGYQYEVVGNIYENPELLEVLR